RDTHAAIFATFVVPSGLASLWGFQQLDSLAAEPWRSASIDLRAVVLGFGTVAAIVLSWRRHPSALVALVMVLLGVLLAYERAAFGLLKLAMFVQPFMLATVTLACYALARRWYLRVVPL